VSTIDTVSTVPDASVIVPPYIDSLYTAAVEISVIALPYIDSLYTAAVEISERLRLRGRRVCHPAR
jgi:hypothetical protein